MKNCELGNEATSTEYTLDAMKQRLFRNPEFNIRKKINGPLLKDTPDGETEICCKIWKMIDKFIKINQPNNTNISNISRQKTQNSKSVTTLLRKEFFATVRTESSLSSSDTSSDLSNNNDQVNKTPSGEASGPAPTVKRLKLFKQTVTKRILRDLNQQSSLDDSLTLPFDILHYIIGCGIMKTPIRDEIYTQLMILTGRNISILQQNRLWLLIQHTLGCFLPTSNLVPYLSKLIKDSPSNYNSSLQNLLDRASMAGPRFQPPSYIEFKALENKKKPEFDVLLMDASLHKMQADAYVTSQEVVDHVMHSIGASQLFGFSLYISLDVKVTSLGNGKDKVFDSISRCEQIHREKTGDSRNHSIQLETANEYNNDFIDESSKPWKLFIRKEIFSPWEELVDHTIESNLIYLQLCRGMLMGEYICDTDQEIAALAARQYFIEFGSGISEDGVIPLLSSYVPKIRLGSGKESKKRWAASIVRFHDNLFGPESGIQLSDSSFEHNSQLIRAEMCIVARFAWPLSFSKFFDVKRVEGPRWYEEDPHMVLAVNSLGLFFYARTNAKDQQVFIRLSERVGELDLLYKAEFYQIDSIIKKQMRNNKENGMSVTVITFIFVDGICLKIFSHDAIALFELTQFINEGLRQKSIWAVAKATQINTPSDECYSTDEFHLISLVQGDLIQLKYPASTEALGASTTCSCTNMATGESGIINSNMIRVLQVAEEPSDDILRTFRTPSYYTERCGIVRNRQKSENVDAICGKINIADECTSV